MKAAEITDALIDDAADRQVPLRARQLRQRRHGRPHRQLPRRDAWRSRPWTSRWRGCCRSIDALGGIALITADHGNADEMYEQDKKTRQPAQNKDGSFKAKTATR